MQHILINWLFIIVLMTIAWIIYRIIKNPGIIDVFWPISITCSGIYFLSTTRYNHIKIIFTALLLIWCIRLAGYLLVTRIVPNIKEKRYLSISKKWKLPAPLGFFLHFQFQGILAIIISLPFHWISNHSDHFNVMATLSATLIVIGIIGETIADHQLNQFKRYNHGRVCNIGLWRLSRHPNYFFEFIVWAGFGLAGLTVNTTGFLSLISPALLLFIMLKLTGPITEAQSLKSRGEEFKAYQDKTSYFIPRPQKNN